ncbi:glycoside hydrolase family 36 protein [Streptomyces sp. NPDC006984]|uniref:glycoside hydrolase family 36 protein n=1 Tax=Streptomyces sp. NPDC006984 TaxID=3155463 RepID=UPI0033EE0D4C
MSAFTASDDAVTTAELPPAPTARLLDDVDVSVLASGVPVPWDLCPLGDGLRMLTVPARTGPVEIRLSVPLGDAAGYWHPQAGWRRTLLADWDGRAQTSLVDGYAAGALYDQTGATMLTFAVADPVPEISLRFGVSEERNSYVVHLWLPPSRDPSHVAFVERSPSVASAMRALRGWLASSHKTMEVPEPAREPVYSTWYAFNQNVDAASVETQAALAARIGCGVLILDDGWQKYGQGRGYAGCGDWTPDTLKFPDFTAHVARVQAVGLRYMAWIAPLLLGPHAECYQEWERHASAPATVPGARVLDPRHPEVRRRVVEVCVGLVRDHGLDGLKIDFLDEAMAYAGDGHGDVGLAMIRLLGELREALEGVRPDVLIELRQPYVGPGMAPFGNMLRSFDCPGDATANRVRTLDTSFLSVGGAVHSDPLMWDPRSPVETPARHLIGALHSVPQISVRLDTLPEDHLESLTFWLRLWRRLRPQVLDGVIEPGRPDGLYTLVEATAEGTGVLTVHGERTVPVKTATHDELVLVNGGTTDSLVLEVQEGGVETESQLTIRDPTGHIIDHSRMDLAPGLHRLPVPSTGLATLRFREGTTQ